MQWADKLRLKAERILQMILKNLCNWHSRMGHIGLLPQTVKAIGGYRKFGTTREEADELYTFNKFGEAGCFYIIAEMMDEVIAAIWQTDVPSVKWMNPNRW